MGFDIGQLLQGLFSGGGGFTGGGGQAGGTDLLGSLIAKINEPGVIDQLAMQVPPPPTSPVDPSSPLNALQPQVDPGTAMIQQTQAQPQNPATAQMPGITPEYAQQGMPQTQTPAPVESRSPLGARATQSLGQLLSGSGVGEVRPQQPQQQARAPAGRPPISGGANPAQIQPINTAPANRLDPQRLQLALGQLLAGGMR